jgi:hypothetical protein
VRLRAYRKVLDRAINYLTAYAEQYEDEGDDNDVADTAVELERARYLAHTRP